MKSAPKDLKQRFGVAMAAGGKEKWTERVCVCMCVCVCVCLCVCPQKTASSAAEPRSQLVSEEVCQLVSISVGPGSISLMEAYLSLTAVER